MTARPVEVEVLAEIERVLRDQLGLLEPVRPGSELAGELQLDSLSLLTLVVELENTFRVALREEDAGEVRTVIELARLVVRRAAEAGEREREGGGERGGEREGERERESEAERDREGGQPR